MFLIRGKPVISVVVPAPHRVAGHEPPVTVLIGPPVIRIRSKSPKISHLVFSNRREMPSFAASASGRPAPSNREHPTSHLQLLIGSPVIRIPPKSHKISHLNFSNRHKSSPFAEEPLSSFKQPCFPTLRATTLSPRSMTSHWKKIVGKVGANARAAAAPADRLARATQIAQLQEHRRGLLETPRNSDDRRLVKYGYRVYSQADEDGILHEIFCRIGEGSKTFVELGAGSGLENNTLFLLIQGWRGVWIEGSERKVAAAKKHLAADIAERRLQVVHQFVTAPKIDSALRRLAPAEVDLLSIDLDGNDYYILEAIRSIRSRVIVAEYNAKFPPDVRWVMEYNEAHSWDSTDYFGSSLKALETLLSERGYALVGCNLLGSNAFFVRRELAADPPFCSPFTAQNHYEPPRYFLLPAFESGFPPGFGPYRNQK